MKGRPDLVIAKLEELSILKRLLSYSPTSQSSILFFGATCMKHFIKDVNAGDLYHPETYRDAVYSPLYADMAVLNDDKDSLLRLLYGTFELEFYSHYNKQLLVQSYLATNPDKLSGDVEGQNDNEENDDEDEEITDDGKEDQEDNKDHNNENNLKNSSIDIHMSSVLFYILGAAIRSALGTLQTLLIKLEIDLFSERIFSCITNCLTVTRESAAFQHLPFHLVETRERINGTLLYPSCAMYSIIESLEILVLEPFFSTTSVVVCMGADFLTYVNLYIESEGYYDQVDKILLMALSEIVEIKDHMYEIAETIRLKLFDYYIKTATKDLINFIMRTLNNNKAVSRLSFRATTLLDSIKKGKVDEL